MAQEKLSGNPLEQFILLAKGAKDLAAVQLIKQVTEAPGVYVFGELLDMSNMQDLSKSNLQYYNLLNLFAYGTYQEYQANQSSLPPLTPLQLRKLKQLSLVTIATKKKQLEYSVLMKELEVSNIRQLEDLVIDAIDSGIIAGKLDERNQVFQVESAIGRDIRPAAIDEITKVLESWCASCETALLNIEQQIIKANESQRYHHELKAKVDNEVLAIRKTIRATTTDTEEQMILGDSVSSSSVGSSTSSSKKQSKPKGLRGSGSKLK